MTRAITVTIGRNIGDEPMPAKTWRDFIEDTRAAVDRHTTELWVAADYKGLWEGSSEDAYVLYGPVPETYQPAVLRGQLEVLATIYGQDAIGYTEGLSELVESYRSPSLVHQRARNDDVFQDHGYQ